MTGKPLDGVRVCLSASAFADMNPAPQVEVGVFIRQLALAIFRAGGHIVHGSHPSIVPILRDAAVELFPGGESRTLLTLVRSAKFMISDYHAEIADHDTFATVLGIPVTDEPTTGTEVVEIRDLVPMRDWMAVRCDVVVAAGGQWNNRATATAGVPAEIETFLAHGKAAFVIGACGGAAAGYLQDDHSLLGRLRNGLSVEENKALDNALGDRTRQPAVVAEVADRIVQQIGLLPLPTGRLKPRTSKVDFSATTIRAQTTGSPNAREMFRILCLDGGGVRGAFTAAVLATWASMLPCSKGGSAFIDQFDLVAGTSTGSILAVGMAMGLQPSELVELYKDNAAQIFPRTPGIKILMMRKYDSQPLRDVLTRLLARRTLSEARRPLVIPTVSAKRGEATVITTPHSPDRTGHRETTAVDAIMASAAAPTFFGEAFVEGPIATGQYIDGGIWANNPVLPAVIEAVGHCGTSHDRIDVLSVGTLMTECDFQTSMGGGLVQWAPSIRELFFAAQESAAAEMARTFLGDARLLRVNDYTRCLPSLDDADAVKNLVERGQYIGHKTFPTVRGRFLAGVPAPAWSRH